METLRQVAQLAKALADKNKDNKDFIDFMSKFVVGRKIDQVTLESFQDYMIGFKGDYIK